MQLCLPGVLEQVPELPYAIVTDLFGAPPQRMFLKKHLELLPWDK